MTGSGERPLEPEEPQIRVTNKRKIGRDAAAAEQAAAAPGGADPAVDPAVVGHEPAIEPGDVPMVEASLLDERTADLQRLQAEYANYRRRAERDRLAAGELATGRVLAELLPVLDDLDRARAHGDLEAGPLKSVADKLDATVTKLGLAKFGEVGDLFDPAQHEAVMHGESEAVDVPTCTQILRPGYRHNERLLRPAMVAVSDPLNGNGGATAEQATEATPADPQDPPINPEAAAAEQDEAGSSDESTE